MVASLEVRRLAANHPSDAHALRPALGELAADFALQGMLDMSATEPRPAPWDDDDAWRSVPLDDLFPFAGSTETVQAAWRVPRSGLGRQSWVRSSS